MSGKYRNAGVALITALLVVAIAGVLAMELVWHTNLDLRRTEGLINWEQARQFGYGAEDFAAANLQQLFDEDGDDAVYSRERDSKLCQRGFSFVLDEGGLAGSICDLEGRFNLNNLLTPAFEKDELVVRQFGRLLRAVDQLDDSISIPADVIDTIVDSTLDWIDPDTSPEGFGGAEDGYYTGLIPPYQAANFWFTDPSELLAVKGMTPEIYEALKHYVAALPVGTAPTSINVNTASEPVFMSLGDDVTLANAELWAQSEEPFTDTEMFHGIVDQAMFPYLRFTTNHLALQGTISIGTTRLDMYSLLERDGRTVRTRLRSFGSIEADAVTAQTVTVKDGEVIEDDE